MTSLLAQYIRANNLGALLGDTDTIFGEFDVRRPDLIYFTKERMHLIQEDQAIDGPPDLCVEILSPSSRVIDRKDKFAQYAQGGVKYYWIVDPKERSIEAFRLSGTRYRPAGGGKNAEVVRLPPFTDLDIPLGDIWFPSRRK